MDKRKLFHVFLKQFLIVFRNWEPVNGGLLPEPSSTSIRSTEYLPHFDDIVVGCFAGHPAEIIILLIEEVTHLTTYVTEGMLNFFSVVQQIVVYSVDKMLILFGCCAKNSSLLLRRQLAISSPLPQQPKF